VSDKPILVTGAHRSGTTWVGKMLALPPGVAYVHEPFSPRTPKGLSPAGFEHYFTVVTSENEGRYRAGLHDDYHYEALVALVDPKHIRAEQRIKAGKFSINGVEMGSIRTVLENGRKLADYRASITVAAIQKAIATRTAVK